MVLSLQLGIQMSTRVVGHSNKQSHARGAIAITGRKGSGDGGGEEVKLGESCMMRSCMIPLGHEKQAS